jgi:hypothetical protein
MGPLEDSRSCQLVVVLGDGLAAILLESYVAQRQAEAS